MFGPNFAEGQHLSPSELKEVPLPEDSFPVMLILCNLIHWNHDSVPLELSPEEIYGISTSVDKYDCIAVTQLTSNVWFGNALKLSLRGKGLFQWLEASYLFNSATGFKAVSAYWLLHWKADNIMFLEEPESDGGSLRALIEIQQKSAYHLFALAALAQQAIAVVQFKDHDEGCEIWKSTVSKRLRAFRLGNLWLIATPSSSLAELLADVESLCRSYQEHLKQGNHECCRGRTSTPFQNNVPALVNETAKTRKEVAQGLCLDCIRVGAKARDEGRRIKHY